jgi:hypothetical protein
MGRRNKPQPVRIVMERDLAECLGFLAPLAAAQTEISIFPFILGAVALMVVIVVVNLLRAKKRTEQFRQIGKQLNLPFFSEGDNSLVVSLEHLHLFSRGRSKRIRNMLHGESSGVELAIFDYRYTVGHGKNARTYHQSVISFRSPMLSLTPFEMQPESVFHKLGGLFGFKDIDFDSHPEFSKKYLLRGEDEARVRELFTPAALSFFESRKKVCVEGGGDQLGFYSQKKRIKPSETREFMQEGLQIFALFRGSVPA